MFPPHGWAPNVNRSGIPNFYWRRRLHLDFEKLSRADGFNARLKHLLAEAGR